MGKQVSALLEEAGGKSRRSGEEKGEEGEGRGKSEMGGGGGQEWKEEQEEEWGEEQGLSRLLC